MAHALGQCINRKKREMITYNLRTTKNKVRKRYVIVHLDAALETPHLRLKILIDAAHLTCIRILMAKHDIARHI